MNLLEVKTLDLGAIRTELELKIQKAPAFFNNCPVVLGFEMLEPSLHEKVDLAGLIRLCHSLTLRPAAARGANAALEAIANSNGLACIAKGREKHLGAMTEKPSMPEAETTVPVEDTTPEPDLAGSDEAQAKSKPTKVVTTPIRSGQQVYAPGGDLIILSQVSAGAEVLADGNIHIYGALRGRALAGVKGDETARIFCTSQEAELVSIAGHFLVDDQLKDNRWQQAVQIQLVDGAIKVRPIQ